MIFREPMISYIWNATYCVAKVCIWFLKARVSFCKLTIEFRCSFKLYSHEKWIPLYYPNDLFQRHYNPYIQCKIRLGLNYSQVAPRNEKKQDRLFSQANRFFIREFLKTNWYLSSKKCAQILLEYWTINPNIYVFI